MPGAFRSLASTRSGAFRLAPGGVEIHPVNLGTRASAMIYSLILKKKGFPLIFFENYRVLRLGRKYWFEGKLKRFSSG